MGRAAIDGITDITDTGTSRMTHINHTSGTSAMATESVTEKAINLRLSESLLREIDDFGFSLRIRSRNEVIRMLIREGLKAHGKPSSADSASSTDRTST
jgi:hypothetical protein